MRQKNKLHFIYNCSFPLAVVHLILVLGTISCKKMVQINEPVNSITTTEVFSTVGTATQAVTSIYNNFTSANSIFGFGNGAITSLTGLSADELKYFLSDPDITQFQTNTLTSDNSTNLDEIWTGGYFSLYQCNATIEGLENSISLPDSIKNELIGEAKFLRAFVNFYLTNLYGNIPLLTTTSFKLNSNISQTPSSIILDQIIGDLKDANNLLPVSYLQFWNRPTRATKAAAIALLSRVYLFKKDWVNAELQATSIITNSDFALETRKNVFLRNSKEAILQFQIDSTQNPYALAEPFYFFPANRTRFPQYYLTNELLNAFEAGDLRRVDWVDSTIYQGVTYYVPAKYKTRFGVANSTPKEYYVVLRLAEQYLIRAEAKAQQNKLSEAVLDLNIIRGRAGLPPLSNNLGQAQVLQAIAQENRIEFFTEWGHRWLDLKRTGQADNALSPIKSAWNSTSVLYPIPLSELQKNPNLTQNNGY
jgi:hypothetical protein